MWMRGVCNEKQSATIANTREKKGQHTASIFVCSVCPAEFNMCVNLSILYVSHFNYIVELWCCTKYRLSHDPGILPKPFI